MTSPKGKHGGKRPGAGRKRRSDNTESVPPVHTVGDADYMEVRLLVQARSIYSLVVSGFLPEREQADPNAIAGAIVVAANEAIAQHQPPRLAGDNLDRQKTKPASLR